MCVSVSHLRVCVSYLPVLIKQGGRKRCVCVTPLQQVSDQQHDEGTGQRSVEVGALSVHATFTVLQIGPGDVHRQPETLPPQPLIECLQHAAGTHTHTGLSTVYLGVDFESDDDTRNNRDNRQTISWTGHCLNKIFFPPHSIFTFTLFVSILFFFFFFASRNLKPQPASLKQDRLTVTATGEPVCF